MTSKIQDGFPEAENINSKYFQNISNDFLDLEFVLISVTYFTCHVSTGFPLELLSTPLGLEVNVCEYQWCTGIHYPIIDLWEGKERH